MRACRAAPARLLALACLLAFAAPGCAAVPAQPLVLGDASLGGPNDLTAPARLFRPAGSGRFPAMVLLHGCDGALSPHYRIWAERLAGWGYVTVLVDSFRPRGFRNVCNQGMQVPPLLQAADAFAAASWLRGKPFVIPGRIGVIGFSHGGWAVMKAVLQSTVAGDGGTPFQAAVAFYPGCERSASPLSTDTLMLIGDADDWTPAWRCERLKQEQATDGHRLDLIVYPGARHGFDSDAPERMYMGHNVGGDQAAAADAIARARQFLADRLRPGQD